MPSSVILRMSYIAHTSTLRITFVSGKVYDYKNVPQQVYLNMKAAPSKGTFFNGHIKDNYSFKKVVDLQN